jgi:hypothetical protein
VVAEVSTKKKAETSKEPKAAAHPKHKMHAYWPPWLAGPLVVGLGSLAHHYWGQSLPAAGIVPLVLVLTTVVLSALTHRYASPRNNVQQWHAVLSVAVLGLSAVLIEMFGTGWPPGPLGQAVLYLSAVLALSWNIRRFDVVRGEGQDKHGTTAEEDWHGLRKPRSMKVTDSDGKQTRAKVKLAAGQTAKDVEQALGAMGSDLGTVTSGIRVEKGKREGDVELTMLWESPLTDSVGWEGPSHVGGSISDPISLGINEQAKPVLLRIGGDYNKGIQPGAVKIVGMPGSGKGVCAVIIQTNLRGRIDQFPVISDHAKGEQMLGMLRPGMPKGKAWINAVEDGETGPEKALARAKAQGQAILRSIAARNKALGDGGFSSWRPEAYTKGFMWRGQHIKMPAITYHIEEFAPVGTASPNLFTTIGEQGRSAGVFLIVSTQRASHDRFPTSLRSLIPNGICYGAYDDTDVSFALSDGTTAGGATPAEWQTKYPGRAMAELNGAEPGMERIPWKTHYAASVDEFESYVKEVMAYLLPMAPDLDPCTAEAFGETYANYLTSNDTVEVAQAMPAQAPKPASVPTTVADDEYGEEDDDDIPEGGDDDMEDTDDPNEGEYVKRALPAELDARGIDPRAPLPAWEGPEIDLAGPPMPGRQMRVLTAAEKRVLFREILQRLADEGTTEVTTAKLLSIWHEELGHPAANQTPTLGRFIADAAAEDVRKGRPNDLLGCLERAARGKYMIMIRPRVAAMNGHRV